jgi:hypothetical protein
MAFMPDISTKTLKTLLKLMPCLIKDYDKNSKSFSHFIISVEVDALLDKGLRQH